MVHRAMCHRPFATQEFTSKHIVCLAAVPSVLSASQVHRAQELIPTYPLILYEYVNYKYFLVLCVLKR